MNEEQLDNDVPFDSREALFDSIAFKVLTYLNTFKEVSDIEFITVDGANTQDFLLWERKNNQTILPRDLKAFYALFNGIVVKWKVELQGKAVTIGEIKLNHLNQIIMNILKL